MNTTIPAKRKLLNISSFRGAPMGRRNNIPSDMSTLGKLRLERLKWVDGDYDQGGAYFGNTGKDYIYWAYGETDTEQVDIFVRAVSRVEAKARIIFYHNLSKINFFR
jgi:hypothetical protein